MFFWAPADPSLGFGSTGTPYFYGGNKVVLSCGFSNPGYTSSAAEGDLVARFTLKPTTLGTSSFSFSNTQYRYIGNTVAGGTSPGYDVTIFESTGSAQQATPTPSPTASSSTTPTPTATSSGTSATATPSPQTLTSSDLNFVEIGVSGGSTSTSLGESSSLVAVDEDDSIPAPGALEPRAAATPFVFGSTEGGGQAQPEGEVLSVQSLRELLIPGKSEADRTVVMVNLISSLTFLVLLGIVIWRLITVSRVNKIKYNHLTEMLSSELSVLESKLGAVDRDALDSVKTDFDKALDNLTEKTKTE